MFPLSQFGPYGMLAGGLIGFGTGMTVGAFMDGANIDTPSWVGDIPTPEIPNNKR